MVTRVHVTQDDHGYWMSVRQTGLGLVLLEWGAERVAPILDELWREPDTEVYFSQSAPLRGRRIGATDYLMPEPRRARRPYTQHRTSQPEPEARV
jgi:hypothetical protein